MVLKKTIQGADLLCMYVSRSQAARGKEKEKDGTTDSGIKLEPVPGLPGGKCKLLADRNSSRLGFLS